MSWERMYDPWRIGLKLDRAAPTIGALQSSDPNMDKVTKLINTMKQAGKYEAFTHDHLTNTGLLGLILHTEKTTVNEVKFMLGAHAATYKNLKMDSKTIIKKAYVFIPEISTVLPPITSLGTPRDGPFKKFMDLARLKGEAATKPKEDNNKQKWEKAECDYWRALKEIKRYPIAYPVESAESAQNTIAAGRFCICLFPDPTNMSLVMIKASTQEWT